MGSDKDPNGKAGSVVIYFFFNLVQFQSLLVKHFYKVVWYAEFGITKNFTRSDLKSQKIFCSLKKGENHGSYFI